MFEINLLAATGGAAGAAAHFDWVYVGKHAFNLAVLLIALYFVLKKPVSGFMQSRKEQLAERFEESTRRLEQAKKIFSERSGKIARLEEETAALKSSITNQAEIEKENILLRASEEKTAILKDAAESASAETKRAHARVRLEAVAAAMRIAEQRLKQSAGAEQFSVKTLETVVREGKWLP